MSDSLQPHEPQHARPPCPVLHLIPWPILSYFCIRCETWVEVYFFPLWMSTCSTTVLVSWEGEGLWLTKCPTLGDLNNGHLFSQSSGSQKSKSKVAARLPTSSESMRKTSPGSLPDSGGCRWSYVPQIIKASSWPLPVSLEKWSLPVSWLSHLSASGCLCVLMSLIIITPAILN